MSEICKCSGEGNYFVNRHKLLDGLGRVTGRTTSASPHRRGIDKCLFKNKFAYVGGVITQWDEVSQEGKITLSNRDYTHPVLGSPVVIVHKYDILSTNLPQFFTFTNVVIEKLTQLVSRHGYTALNVRINGDVGPREHRTLYDIHGSYSRKTKLQIIRPKEVASV